MKEKFKITGMNCSMCAKKIENAVLKLDFVKKVSVNLLNNSMTVEYEGKNSDKIKKIIEKIGYKISDYDNKNIEFKILKKRCLLNFIFAIPLFYLSMGCMFRLPYWNFLEKNILLNSFIQFFLLLPLIIINFDYFKNGFKSAFNLSFNMNSLVSAGVLSSFLYGVYVLIKSLILYIHGSNSYVEFLSSNIYFESAGMVLAFVTLGKMLETGAKNKTMNLISKLNEFNIKEAYILKDGHEEKIPFDQIKTGDILIVREGESVPADGTIIKGEGLFDQSLLTGESLCVYKKEGEKIYSGAINKEGYFEIKADKVGEDTLLSKIIKLTEKSLGNKPHIQKLTDKISLFFVPFVIFASILTFIFWFIFSKDFENALLYAVCTLVVSCPCALGLAVPASITTMCGVGAKIGILFKNSEIIEKIQNTTTVVFDKTGTLTKGKIKVDNVLEDKLNRDEIIKISASIEQFSNHPYALAIKKESKDLYPVENFSQSSGLGVLGKIKDETYYLGSKNFIQKQGILCPFEFDGIILAKENEILGKISFTDEIKDGAKEVIQKLSDMKIETIMLTGDNKIAAEKIASKIGIKNVISEVLPDEKYLVIEKLKNENKRVLMVGDGINDAPALALADVSIAVHNGADVAVETSDTVLMKDDLYNIVNAILLSKFAFKNIKQNLFWALIYNVLFIPVAMGFFVPFNIKFTPDISALLMSLSSFFVVSNALRINTFKPFKRKENIMKKEITIEGMMCSHCANSVKENLLKCPLIEDVEVNLKDKKAIIFLKEDIKNSEIQKIIKNAGYEIIKIENI